MDHIICVNQNSFPANDKTSGVELFNQALQGVLRLQSGRDRFLFYLDTNTGELSDFLISPDFSYADFITDCDDVDMALFLAEVEDKSPALDNLSNEQLDEMAAYNFYIQKQPVDTYPDVYALAWAVSGYLLSINTSPRWDSPEINICRADGDGRYIDEVLILKNISTINHGEIHSQSQINISLEELAHPHIVTKGLCSWFMEQTNENKDRILAKVKLACIREFKGSKPLFETLTNGDGLREIRIPAYSGGAIRILFKCIKGKTQALLVGFIKFSNSEGYDQAMKTAQEKYDEIVGAS